MRYCAQIKELKTKSNLILYLLYYAVLCNEFARTIFGSLCLRATLLLSQNTVQRWRAVGNIASNLIGTRFESKTSSSKDEAHVSLRPKLHFNVLAVMLLNFLGSANKSQSVWQNKTMKQMYILLLR